MDIIKSSFNTGEVSEEVYGRTDLEKYVGGCKILENFICLAHGPITRTPGKEYIAGTKDSTKKSRVIDFIFSTEQAYMLEFGDFYIRFFKDGAQILDTQKIENAKFEDDPQDIPFPNWTKVGAPATYEQSTVQKHAGSFSFHFTGNDTQGIQSKLYASITGETYNLDMWVYPIGVTEVRVQVRKGDDSGWLDETVHTVVAATWNNITDVLAETAGGVGAYVRITSNGAAREYYIDDVKMTEQDLVCEIVSPYSEDDIFGIDTAQSADVLYIAHPNFFPRTLTRNDHDDWWIEYMEEIDGPWLDENTSAVTITASATTGQINLTASADLFVSTDVGRLVKIDDQAGTPVIGIAVIYEFTSATVVKAYVWQDFAAAPGAETKWYLGKWSDTEGGPKSVTFDNDRLEWAGHTLYPQEMWFSKVGIYSDHGISSPLVDDDALELTVGAKKSNAIRWIQSGTKLILGTAGSENMITSATGDGPITALSKYLKPGSFNGCDDLHPVEVGNALLYVQLHGKVLRELLYSWENDLFAGEELTLLAGHLTRQYPIVAMAYQSYPYKVLWCARSDGLLLGLTYYREHQVFGWHRHPESGKVESLATIPGDNEDEIWMIVKRDVNSAEVRYVERLHETFTGGTFDDSTDAFFVNSGLTLDNQQTVTSFTQADPGVFTLTGHGYLDDDVVRLRSVDKTVVGEEDYESLHNLQLIVDNKAPNTFELKDEEGNLLDTTLYKQTEILTVAKNVTAISGLSHLEGEIVSVLADGAPVSQEVVTAGAITLDAGASVIHIGLPFISNCLTLNPEVVLGDNATSQILSKKIDTLVLRLYQTLGGKVGPNENDLSELQFASDVVPMGQAPFMFSGDTKQISFKGGWSREAQVYIRQDQPLPMTTLALFADLEE